MLLHGARQTGTTLVRAVAEKEHKAPKAIPSWTYSDRFLQQEELVRLSRQALEGRGGDGITEAADPSSPRGRRPPWVAG
jgi:hypothetical protein